MTVAFNFISKCTMQYVIHSFARAMFVYHSFICFMPMEALTFTTGNYKNQVKKLLPFKPSSDFQERLVMMHMVTAAPTKVMET
jgi:hypothetical protein